MTTTVIFDISMSLDGYVTAAHQTAAEPMGEGGEALHEWAFGDDPANRELLASTMAGLGAVIAGRRTYDHSLPWWGADGPTGAARRPVVVVTHQAPAQSPDGGVYEFVTAGIHTALERAKALAGDGGRRGDGRRRARPAVHQGRSGSRSSPSIWCPCCSAAAPGCSTTPRSTRSGWR